MEKPLPIDQVQLEAMREAVWNEIEEKWQRDPLSQEERSFHDNFDPNESYDLEERSRTSAFFTCRKIENYLNNFYFNFPPSLSRPMAHYRPMAQKLGIYDTTPAELHHREREDYKRPSKADPARYDSPLKLNQTYRQFFDTVDMAIEQEGISEEELDRLETTATQKYADPRDSLKFQEAILKVYIRLRATGYNKFDLTA